MTLRRKGFGEVRSTVCLWWGEGWRLLGDRLGFLLEFKEISQSKEEIVGIQEEYDPEKKSFGDVRSLVGLWETGWVEASLRQTWFHVRIQGDQ